MSSLEARTTHSRPARRRPALQCGGKSLLRPRDPPHPFRQVLLLPRPRQGAPEGRSAARHPRGSARRPSRGIRKHPEKSEALIRIFSDDEDEIMPPPDSHRKLTETQKNLIRTWVEQGAEYETHWAFVAPPAGNPRPGNPRQFLGEKPHRLLHPRPPRKGKTPAHPPRPRPSAGCAASPSPSPACRRPRPRSTPSSPTPHRKPMKPWWTACSLPRASANTWPRRGSISHATRIPSAIRRTSRPRPGPTAIG